MDRPLRAVRCPLLIGRDDLLELTDRRLDDVLAGHGQFLLLAGQAGIGKTRLLAAIRRKAEARGFAAVEGAVAPQDHDVPASSILDLARSMARIPAFGALGEALLELDKTVLAAEHAQRRRLVMETVELILASLPGPTMLSFEDLQWADDVSLEIIAELARQSRDRTLLLTGDYRTEDVPRGTNLRQWRARLITQRIAEEVRLVPLDAAETALVTTLILDTGLPAPRDVAAAVYERTDGIPLHIEELLGALSAEARADGTAIREAGVPETIEDAIIARISTLSPEAQATARAGAVIGRCFVPDVLAGIMDVPASAIEAPLQELVDQFVLDPPGVRGLYDFRHQLLRDALYRTIPLSERRRYHARAGEFGARLEGASEIHASVHYERAGLRREAFDAALTGAREAARLSARREAFELYHRAVNNMPDDLDSSSARGSWRPARTRLSRSRSTRSPSRWRSSAALALPRSRGAGPRRHRPRERPDRLATRGPTRVRAAGSGRRAAGRGRGAPGQPRRARGARARRALDGPDVHGCPGRSTRPGRSSTGCPRWATSSRIPNGGRSPSGSTGLPTCSSVTSMPGSPGSARSPTRRCAKGGRSTGVTAFREASTAAASGLDYPAAVRWIDEGIRYADSIEQSHCAHVMRATLAMVSWAAAEPSDAQRRARRAIVDKGCRRGAMTAHWALGYVAMSRGELDDATTALAEALEFGIASEEIEIILPPLWGMAEVALQAGDPDRALGICRDALARAVAVDERVLLTPFVVTGSASRTAGRSPRRGRGLARRVRDAAECRSRRSPTPPSTTRAGWSPSRKARPASPAPPSNGGRRLGPARPCVGGDLGPTRPRPQPLRTNRFADAGRWDRGTNGGRSPRIAGPLRARRCAPADGPRARSDDEPWRPLTTREFEVARLVGEGMTNARSRTPRHRTKTASSHVEHILTKLGASRRAEIATWASQVQSRPTPRTAQPVEHATRV